ncbi:hypothetical protein [Eoetvoesiella caeni]|uniref:Beta-barrel assembly machine subunit BamE n=1 Tax=Eoetvoesiella caeni TaxID=645616 RepID=A0A366HLV9_9BURK|nr:hypothetical protein [Eoetvoesiella caeni]MCI2807295.1 hypothetical protein [Eoetvoesiella caeni]NYT53310.1 hypothetical protein [Eoetvoesiella caeni]RBP43292.1 hypothetical protein DFR37_101421 [Eoetvoesiella caeni]
MKHSARTVGRFSWRLATAGAALALLAACSTTGQSFDSAGLSKIVPGTTTLTQAEGLLGAAPTDIYRQLDGSLTARWAQKSSVLTDAIYLRKELWLRFDSYGRFERVVNSVNVMSEPGKPPAAPNTVPGQNAQAASPAPNPLADTSAKSIDNTVVSYPLSAE